MSSYERAIEIIESNGKAYCRGPSSCNYWLNKIPKGQRVLRISIYGAGGWCQAFYCSSCMKQMLDMMDKCLEQSKK